MKAYNFLIHNINNKVARSFVYHGMVIDLGSGISPYKNYILKSAHTYVAVDWLAGYHDKSNVDVFANLLKEFPFSTNCTDTVVTFQVLEHIPEPKFFLSEAIRILRPGGKIIITVPFMWHVHEAPYDYFRYTRYGLRYLLTQVGFADIEIIENTGFWQMWVLKFNYHTARSTPGLLKLLWLPVWWLGQAISPFLDRLDRQPDETASYTVVAKKP